MFPYPSPEILAAGYSGRGAAATGGGTSGGIQVSFNPQFFLNGRETTAPAGLTGALNMSLHELEKCWSVCWLRNNVRSTADVCRTG